MGELNEKAYMRKGGIVAYTWDDVCYLVDSGEAKLEDFVVIFDSTDYEVISNDQE